MHCYVVVGNQESQLLCVNHNYHVLIIAIIYRKGKLCVKEFTYFTLIKLVIKVKLLISMYTMIMVIMIISVHNNRIPESYYHPPL